MCTRAAVTAAAVAGRAESVCVSSHGERTGAGNTPPAQLSTPVCCLSVCRLCGTHRRVRLRTVRNTFHVIFYFFKNSFYASDAPRRGLSQRSASRAQVRTVKRCKKQRCHALRSVWLRSHGFHPPSRGLPVMWRSVTAFGHEGSVPNQRCVWTCWVSPRVNTLADAELKSQPSLHRLHV